MLDGSGTAAASSGEIFHVIPTLNGGARGRPQEVTSSAMSSEAYATTFAATRSTGLARRPSIESQRFGLFLDLRLVDAVDLEERLQVRNLPVRRAVLDDGGGGLRRQAEHGRQLFRRRGVDADDSVVSRQVFL